MIKAVIIAMGIMMMVALLFEWDPIFVHEHWAARGYLYLVMPVSIVVVIYVLIEMIVQWVQE